MNKIISYEAEVCGKVPLHQTNLIQPHGVLIVVKSEDLQVVQVSENIDSIFGHTAKEVVQQPLSRWIGESGVNTIRERLGSQSKARLPFLLELNGRSQLAMVQQSGSFLLIEIELNMELSAQSDSLMQMYQELKYIMSKIESSDTVATTCETVVKELKQLSGFDKVMLYRFDEEWNGDVIAEAKEESMDAYIGLKFPASDIPPQARALYKKAAFRLIPAVNYEPVRLYPILNPVTNAFTDLSDSALRSVAGVHIQYLRNMGVQASMSTRILVDGELWGLIACHHIEPRYLSFQTCWLFELVSIAISAKINAVQKSDGFHFRTRMQEHYNRLVAACYREDALSYALSANGEDLLKLLNADGVALVFDRSIETVGETPDDISIEDLVLWLQSSTDPGIYHQPSLSAVFEPAEAYSEACSGLLSLPIQADRGSFILAFRKEAVREVFWGGNPNEAVQFEPDKIKYHPRASFKMWQQSVEKTAIPWTEHQLYYAGLLRNFVVEFVLNRMYQR